MEEKKVTGRNITIVLGIVCIILAVGLVKAIADYTATINEKDNIITTRNLQITDKDSQISSLNSQVTNLQNQANNLTEIVNLAKSKIWADLFTMHISPDSYNSVFAGGETDYAGYINVQIHSSTIDNTYARVIYSSNGMDYDQQVTIGNSGSAVFPILPTQDVEVRVGNPTLLNAVTIITVTYNY